MTIKTKSNIIYKHIGYAKTRPHFKKYANSQKCIFLSEVLNMEYPKGRH